MHYLRRFWNHPWTCTFCNIFVVLVIYTLMRAFFYVAFPRLFWGNEFSHVLEMFLGGIRFDLTAVLYLSSLYIFLMVFPTPEYVRNSFAFHITTKLVYYIPNALGIIVNCMDMPYIQYTSRRTNATVFTEFAHDKNIGSIILEGMGQYWFVTLFCILMLMLLWVCYRRPKIPIAINRKVYYSVETAFLFITAYFTVIGIRGGFGRYTRPITISNAMQYVEHPNETALVLNTPFTLMKSLEPRKYEDPAYFQRGELPFIMTPVHEDVEQDRRINVVVIILESFATEHIGFYNHDLDDGTYQGFTPNLDSILARSVTYKYSYSAGRKSIDAMPSVLSSIPMLIEPYITTPYATNQVSSVAKVLREQRGYQTAFFHGAPNGSMGFQAYARSAGFGNYYGLDEYYRDPDGDPRAFDGTWAIWDEEFLQYFCHTMTDDIKQPFVTSVFTASSHHPYRLPKRYEGKFPEGPEQLCRCIAYSDYALGEFFREAAKQPWFDNTLFVITADHTSQLYHEEYLTPEGLFRVPIAFYMPSLLKPRYDTTQIVSQTDIMPSILGLTGTEEYFFAFGEDALTKNKRHNYAVCYNYPNYQIMSLNGTIQFDGEKVVSASETLTEAEKTDMVRYLKAYAQQYISRMITNRLVIVESDTK